MGELSTTHGLRCEDCANSPTIKTARGCGVPPVYAADRYAEKLVYKTWLPDDWILRCLEAKIPVLPNRASEEYIYANLADVYDHTGSLWPWCPAWFSPARGFLPESECLPLERAFQLAVYAKRGILAWAAPSPPTERQAESVASLLNLIQNIQNQIDEREMKRDAAARAAARATQGRDG